MSEARMELKLTIDDGETIDIRNFTLLPMVTSNKFTYTTADGAKVTIELKQLTAVGLCSWTAASGRC